MVVCLCCLVWLFWLFCVFCVFVVYLIDLASLLFAFSCYGFVPWINSVVYCILHVAYSLFVY